MIICLKTYLFSGVLGAFGGLVIAWSQKNIHKSLCHPYIVFSEFWNSLSLLKHIFFE